MLRGRIGNLEEEDTEIAPDDATAAAALDSIVQRLIQYGLPDDVVRRKKEGFAEYLKDHPNEIRSLAAVLLPGTTEVKLLTASSDEAQLAFARRSIEDQCREALLWLQYYALGPDGLQKLRNELGADRGVCGAVWGPNDIAYRCHTCEHDPTCAICVPCFQAGDHTTHDYAMIKTSGGCCDCGDPSAWKEAGFCSRHRGPGQVPPPPVWLVATLRPVLEALFLEWKERLLEGAKHFPVESGMGRWRKWFNMSAEEKSASAFSMNLINMLLEFCNCSESMLSFIVECMSSEEIGLPLLNVIFTAEYILPKNVNDKLHELLYKLLGDPNFKYRFARVFIARYPNFLRECLYDDPPRKRESILGSFSVQIFTVPSLTPRLVLEWKLLDMLFLVLKEFFLSCIGEDGRFMVSKPVVQERLYIRAVDDVRYVMSHLKVAQYVVHEYPQLCRTWMQFLAILQGMYPQKRITSIHIEEENEDWVSVFFLDTYMAKIQPLFVSGTSLVGRDSWKDESGNVEWSLEDNSEAYNVIEGVKLSKALLWMISENVEILDSWFSAELSRDSLGSRDSSRESSQGNSPQRRRTNPRTLVIRESVRNRPEVEGPPESFRERLRRVRSDEEAEMDIDEPLEGAPSDYFWWLSEEPKERPSSVGESNWPQFEFDVGKQEVSFHIPLHRLLSLLLFKALEEYETKNIPASRNTSASDNIRESSSFLLRLFPESFQVVGLPALLMEHPLQLQVLCAQVQAGMWRRNGHTIVGLCDIYRSVQWCEDSLELDLFMLQCCGSMAPAEDFVARILSCFGLSDYFSLYLWKPNEYEPALAQEFLVLLIRIISERGFCGLSSRESLRRELIQRLAIGDAAHSSLMNALPPRLREGRHVQETLDAIALYRKPHGMQQGKYILREQSWRELDLYHPRWTPRELQSAEERYLRVCRSSAIFSQPPTWRDPYPPLKALSNISVSARVHEVLRATFFHAAYSQNLSDSRSPENLLFTALHLLSLGLDVCYAFYHPSNCSSSTRPPLLAHATDYVHVAGDDGIELSDRQSTISLLVQLMRKYIASEGAQLMVSETNQYNVSSFIKKQLHRFAELDRQCMYAIESLAPEIVHRVSAESSTKSLDSSKEKLQSEISDIERKKTLALQRQAAILAKMRAAQDKFMASVETKTDSKPEGKRPREPSFDADLNDAVSPVCALCLDRSSTSPLCILALVQRSRLLSLAQKPVPSWDKRNSTDALAAVEEDNSVHNLVRREAENLISELRQWLEGAVADPNGDRLTNRDDFFELLRGELPAILNTERFAASGTGAEPSRPEAEEEGEYFYEYPESGMIFDSPWWEHLGATSISDANYENNHAVVSVLTEYVTAAARTRREDGESEAPPLRENTPTRIRRLRNSIESKVYNSIGLNDFVGLHLSSCGHTAHYECFGRYYCSLLQRYNSRSLFEGAQVVDPDLGEFLCPVCRRLSNSVLPVLEPIVRNPMVPDGTEGIFRLDQAYSLMHNAEDLMSKPGFRKSITKKIPESLKAVLGAVSKRLCGLFYPEKYDNQSGTIDGRNYQGLFLWDLLRYSIMSAELAARTRSLILGLQDPASRLVALEDAADSSRGSTLPLLCLTANLTLTHSRQAVLLRTRGLQLMVGSICHGVSRDLLSERSPKGTVHSLLHYLEKGQDSADVQFWKRAADPILVHDPFSSLVWLLFALPLPLPWSEGPFTSVVHLFYLVCLIQCYGSLGRAVIDPTFPENVQSFLTSVQATLSSTCLNVQQDTEDALSTVVSSSQMDTVRRYTLPYLRRCALLQTVCNGASSPVPVAGSNSWELSNVYSLLSTSAYREKPSSTEGFELKEAEELERRFHLPPLQAILADEGVQNLAMKWCQHLHHETGSRYFACVPRPTRAVPFQLMRLPHLYQDLLQRYIKERCARCKSVPERAALCLLCGTLCCGSGSNGCCSLHTQSECYRHAVACGGGVGVYLMVRKTNVLLLRRERQTMWPSPYLDAFGEEDQDMRRGKPLFLSEERYAALTAMVASHSLDYSSSVLSHTTRDAMF